MVYRRERERTGISCLTGHKKIWQILTHSVPCVSPVIHKCCSLVRPGTVGQTRKKDVAIATNIIKSALALKGKRVKVK